MALRGLSCWLHEWFLSLERLPLGMSLGSLGEGVPAELSEPAGDDRVQCTACAHRCTLDPGQRGICDVRMNVEGELRLLTYGNVYDDPFGLPGTVDPIEKKPLYHYKPGTTVLSFGGASCNFACQFCQNHHIAFSKPEDIDLRDVSPAEAAESAGRRKKPSRPITHANTR